MSLLDNRVLLDYIKQMKDNRSQDVESVNSLSPEDASKPQTVDRRIQVYQEQLRRVASELSLAEARERREIASDLHDHIGQALAFVSQKVRLLQGDSIFCGREHEFSEILSILEQTIRYTRNLTVEISPPVLYELGLPSAIDWLTERANRRHGITVKLSQKGRPQEIDEDIRVFIFKAIQELIYNAVKHAGVKKVNIRANWGDESLEIIVSDTGKGFDTTNSDSSLSGNCCFGLFSIRERLSYIGGKLSIDSAPGKGTRVSIIAPYSLNRDADND